MSLYCLLMALEYFCHCHHITNGSIILGCDNKSILCQVQQFQHKFLVMSYMLIFFNPLQNWGFAPWSLFAFFTVFVIEMCFISSNASSSIVEYLGGLFSLAITLSGSSSCSSSLSSFIVGGNLIGFHCWEQENYFRPLHAYFRFSLCSLGSRIQDSQRSIYSCFLFSGSVGCAQLSCLFFIQTCLKCGF